jgi:hypothetical protein
MLIVDLKVLLQIGPRGELLVASVANVGFLPCVDPLMSDQVRDL